ncbi:MAG: DUF6940 family protein [Pseudomonadales bacterium]
MWNAKVDILDGGRVRKFELWLHAERLNYAQVVGNWEHDATFRVFFIGLLADAPFPAYFWETPPVELATFDQPFEFVLVDSPHMAAMAPDPTAFERYFEGSTREEGIVSFLNLGKDARLLVPCPLAPISAYASMATFARRAPEPQQHALWEAVGATMGQAVQEQTVWLSTCGLGVAWLHVRLDNRPKYYSYAPYC